ncbi:hypothetical protein F5Y05DRAFT_397654 [Hypoxylon sp. FL0543]|nr:hypothetical protein F5Y05DRAFT_397654 [Hypoxylon sp. FL0543]
MSTATLVGDEEPADTYSRIAIAIGPGGVTNAGLLAGDWNRDPSWLWPPPLNQPYCKLHFLKECSLYHLHENENFKRAIATRTPKIKKGSKWPTKPTRIQPARRAREKNWKDHSSVSTNSRDSSPARGDNQDGFSRALETRREELQLHLPWPIYKTRLEGRINQISDLLQKKQRDSYHLPYLFSSSSRGAAFQCRYCGFNPEVVDYEGSAPRRLAPPAPMHCIQQDGMREEQVGEFAGLKFAIDMAGEHEMVIPLGMGRLSDFVGRERARSAKEESLESTSINRLGKRRGSELDKHEKAAFISGKRRRGNDSFE